MNITNELPAQSGNTKSLMVLLHGVGSNGDDLFGLVPYFKPSLQNTYFFAPDGIEPCDMAAFGYQWFSLQDRSEGAKLAELQRVTPIINAMIDNKKQQLGLQDDDVILCGFSQGAMVSLYLTLSQPKTYRAVIAFSGALVMPEVVYKTETPICLIHGIQDEVVPYSNMYKARDALQDIGMHVDVLGRPNLAHSIDMEGLDRASQFILHRL